MAITKALIFTQMRVNNTNFSPHLNEGVEVGIETVTDLVADGQTLPSAYDVSFSAILYDDAPLANANVYSNTAQTPVLANVVFTGATGGQTLTINGVYVNAEKVFDQNRTGVRLFGTKRTTALATSVVES